MASRDNEPPAEELENPASFSRKLRKYLYHNPDVHVSVSRTQVSNIYLSILEVVSILVVNINLREAKQNDIVIYFTTVSAGNIFSTFIIRAGISLSNFKTLRVALCAVTGLIFYFFLFRTAALDLVCKEIKSFSADEADRPAISLCRRMMLIHRLNFIIQCLMLTIRVVSILIAHKAYRYLKNRHQEIEMRKKRKLRYSKVQRKKLLLQSDGAHVNPRRKL